MLQLKSLQWASNPMPPSGVRAGDPILHRNAILVFSFLIGYLYPFVEKGNAGIQISFWRDGANLEAKRPGRKDELHAAASR